MHLSFKVIKLFLVLKSVFYVQVLINIFRQHFSKFPSPIVFCHNDMQEGNILIKNEALRSDSDDLPDSDYDLLETSDLIIIDYEYCAYNYRSYEIANHFMEWVFNYKVPDFPYFSVHPEEYPSLKQQVSCMDKCHHKMYVLRTDILSVFFLLQREFIGNYLRAVGSQELTETVMEEVRHFTLASHLLWAIWSLVNGKSSKITFGYWVSNENIQAGCYTYQFT